MSSTQAKTPKGRYVFIETTFSADYVTPGGRKHTYVSNGFGVTLATAKDKCDGADAIKVLLEEADAALDMMGTS